MHRLLEKILNHRGIKNVTDLSPEESKTFDGWENILSRKELTIEDVQKYCEGQVSAIEAKWKDLDIDQSKKAEMIPYHTVYKSLLAVLRSPQVAREALEKQLNDSIK